MSGLIGIWWVWVAIALVFSIIEVMGTGFIFLGFALGALATALFVAIWTAPSAALLMAVFGVASLLAWIGLRRVFRHQSSGARIVTKDVND